MAVRLAELLASRVRRLSELAEDSILLALARNYGVETGDGTRIDLRLPQQALGEMVGTSRESVNKQLRDWTQRGLVRFERGTVTIRDAAGLEALAHLALD